MVCLALVRHKYDWRFEHQLKDMLAVFDCHYNFGSTIPFCD
jgi:hypothetical protein